LDEYVRLEKDLVPDYIVVEVKPMSDKQKKIEVRKMAASKKRSRDVWQLRSGDAHVTVATSAGSTTVIDGAVKRYANALKRLAKR
jgi:hypothetical protein